LVSFLGLHGSTGATILQVSACELVQQHHRMIRYQLHCANRHEFEAWFKDSRTCDRQLERRAFECPVCGERMVEKSLMAPRVAGADGGPADNPPMAVVATGLREKLRELRRSVEANCDYVGEGFTEEARRIHYGEIDPRGIYGEATDQQHEALQEEGIEVARIPWVPGSDA
jgi:hypothetical protein